MTAKKIKKKSAGQKSKAKASPDLRVAFLCGASPAQYSLVMLDAFRQAVEQAQELGSKAPLLVAIDGGAFLWSRLGLLPNLWVGDGDSVGAPLQKSLKKAGVEVVGLKRQKDESDFAVALNEAIRRGANHIVGLGLLEGLGDHHLAVTQDAALGVTNTPKAAQVQLELWDTQGAIYLFVGASKNTGPRSIELDVDVGTLVSVFPVCGPANGVTLQGFRYALKNSILEPGSRGLSNIATQNQVSIRVTNGSLVIILRAQENSSRENVDG